MDPALSWKTQSLTVTVIQNETSLFIEIFCGAKFPRIFSINDLIPLGDSHRRYATG